MVDPLAALTATLPTGAGTPGGPAAIPEPPVPDPADDRARNIAFAATGGCAVAMLFAAAVYAGMRGRREAGRRRE
jgi:hypothetical protein